MVPCMKIAMLYVTHADLLSAEKLVKPLLDEKWIACANYFPVTASYHWQGNLEREDEMVSLLKTRPENVEELKSILLKTHPYDVPCILHWEVEANPDYAQWIYETTRRFAGT